MKRRGGVTVKEKSVNNTIFGRKKDMEKDMLYSKEEKDCSYAIYTYSIKNSIKKGVYFFCMDKVRWGRRKYIKKRDGKISELDLTYFSESHTQPMCSRSSRKLCKWLDTTYVI